MQFPGAPQFSKVNLARLKGRVSATRRKLWPAGFLTGAGPEHLGLLLSRPHVRGGCGQLVVHVSSLVTGELSQRVSKVSHHPTAPPRQGDARARGGGRVMRCVVARGSWVIVLILDG